MAAQLNRASFKAGFAEFKRYPPECCDRIVFRREVAPVGLAHPLMFLEKTYVNYSLYFSLQ